MEKTPLYERLRKHKELDRASFHTPGHKCSDFLPKELLSLDLTELPDTDALYEADGVIRETEKNLAILFDTRRSLISAGGCTLAIQTMLACANVRGKKMIFARNSHRSAAAAAALLGITPVWVSPQSSDCFTGRVRAEDIETILKKEGDVSAVYITSPDYYGEITDIEALSQICKRYNALLLVDNAHGSHLAFGRKNMHPVHLGADASACSLHKTLPVLTGGAALNINNQFIADNAKESMALFGSTSPSYPIMASIDICCGYMLDRGKRDYAALEDTVGEIKSIAAKKGITIPSGICDPLRICINTECTGLIENQYEYFARYGIDPEFCDGSNVVFICTPFNSASDFDRLKKAIKALPDKIKEPKRHRVPLPKQALLPRDTLFLQKETVAIKKSLGRICADLLCPCPPGVPVAVPGEIIDEVCISVLEEIGIAYIKCIK